MFGELFHQQGLSIDRLRALVEVSSTGSISKAVGGDPIRQSLYSRQLKELGEYFGVELTQRKGRGLIITEKGKELAQLAREQFQALSDFKQSCSNKDQMFNIGAGDSLLHWLLIPALGSIEKGPRKLTFSLHNLRSRDIVEQLTSLEIDFGIVRPNRIVRPIKSKVIGEVHYALFIPRNLVRKGSKLEDLLPEIPIATQANDSAFRTDLLESARKSGIELNLRLYCESFPEARQALYSGTYAAILPSIAASDLSEKQYISTNPPFLKQLKRQIALAWNPRTLRFRPDSEYILDALAKILRQELV